MSQALINSIAIVVLGAVLAFISALFWFVKNNAMRKAERLVNDARDKADQLAKEKNELEDRVRDLELKFTAVNERVIPISAAFQAMLIKELTHFHTPEMDALMVKIGPPNVLTAEERDRLTVLLLERAKDMNGRISELERDAAVMLPMVMKRALAEAAALEVAPSELQIVEVLKDSLPE